MATVAPPSACNRESDMRITGIVEDRGGTWVVTDSVTDKRYTLSGVQLPQRCDGLTVQLVGIIEDSFGLGVLHADPVMQVQRWKTV